MLHQGDCLDILPTLEAESVALIYADPPFNSGRNYAGKAGQFTDTWDSMDAYLDFMRARLVEMRRVLSGSIYFHCDDSACHRLRCLMDDVFGEAAYRNTVIWVRSGSRGKVSRTFGRLADFILVYAMPKATFNPQYKSHLKASAAHFRHDDKDGKGPYRWNSVDKPDHLGYRYDFMGYPCPRKGYVAPLETMEKWHREGRLVLRKKSDGSLDHSKPIHRKFYLSESKGAEVGNVWGDISRVYAKAHENVNYPTQKPLALLERIVEASSVPGDLVFDPFMGSGTALVAAKKMGRRFGGCDVSADAIRVATERLADADDLLSHAGVG